MTYSEAKPFLKEGMKVLVLSCSWKDHNPSNVGQEYKISNIGEPWGSLDIAFNCLTGPLMMKEDQFEILTNPDGTPWVHPDKKIFTRKREFKVGDRVRVLKRNGALGTIRKIDSSKDIQIELDNGGFADWYIPFPGTYCFSNEYDSLEKIEDDGCNCTTNVCEYCEPKINESMTQKVTKTMNSIVKKIKDLKLSEEDRILRKHGFEDEDGKMTPEADDLMDTEVNEERWAKRQIEIAASLKLVEQSEK